MTEAEWLTCTDPAQMLTFVKEWASDRKLRLLACARGRDDWRRMTDERSRDAIVAAERFADGEATFAELLVAHRQATDSREDIPLSAGRQRNPKDRRRLAKGWAQRHAAEMACRAADPTWDARAAIRGATWGKGAVRVALSDHIRDIFNPFRNSPISPAWLTSTVVALTTEVYESRAFELMPILADALQDAGCEDEEILTHCRAERGHVRGCWVLDGILGRG